MCNYCTPNLTFLPSQIDFSGRSLYTLGLYRPGVGGNAYLGGSLRNGCGHGYPTIPILGGFNGGCNRGGFYGGYRGGVSGSWSGRGRTGAITPGNHSSESYNFGWLGSFSRAGKSKAFDFSGLINGVTGLIAGW